MILNKLQTIANRLDSFYFKNNESRQIKAARFFFFSSRVTAFFLFNRFGKFVLNCIIFYTFFVSALYFRSMVGVFADYSVMEGIYFMVKEVPNMLLFLLLFTIFLLDIAYINTCLVMCDSVKNKICLLFGNNILKQRFCNSTVTSAVAASQLSKNILLAAAGGVVGGVITNIAGEYLYSRNYGKYVDTVAKYPELGGEPSKGATFSVKFGKN